MTVDLVNGTANDGMGGTDTLLNIEAVYGSAFADSITGGAENNNFQGGAGDDTMDGGAGTDIVTYFNDLDSNLDGFGVTVNLSSATISGTWGVAYSQAAGTATDGWGGTDTLIGIENLKGSNYNDVLVGDAGSNSLNGSAGDDLLFGGLGRDTLTGGTGNDTFVFDSLPAGKASADLVTDFGTGSDQIAFDISIFTSLGLNPDGSLMAGQLASGANLTTATSADSHLIYDTCKGNLYYDADADGTDSTAVLIATFGSTGNHPALSEADMHAFGLVA